MTNLGWLARLEARVGFRGSRLIIYGAIWVMTGVGTMLVPRQPDVALVIHEKVPSILRGDAWVATGAYAAWVAHRRGPDGRAWAALTIMPAVRMLSWLSSGAVWVVTSIGAAIWGAVPIVGTPVGLPLGCTYAAIVALITSSAHHHCAGLVLDPPPDHLLPEDRP